MARSSHCNPETQQDSVGVITEVHRGCQLVTDKANVCTIYESTESQLFEDDQKGVCEDFILKNKLDGSWSQCSFSRSLLKAEALLRSRFNPSLWWLLRGCSEDDEEEGEDENSFVAAHNLVSRSSARLILIEQCILGLSSQWQVVCGGPLYSRIPQICIRCEFPAEGIVSHHPPFASFNQHYEKLNRLLEQRAQLLFQHEYVRRTQAATGYVTRLSKLLESELAKRPQTQNLSQSLDQPDVACSLGFLGLSQELRYHLVHWEALCAKACSDCYLRAALARRTHMLVEMKQVLNILAQQALVLMECWTYTALNSLARTQVDNVQKETLKDLLVGVELFNRAVEDYRGHHSAPHWWNRILQLLTDRPQNTQGLHPNAFLVEEVMRVQALHHGHMVVEELHSWASRQSYSHPEALLHHQAYHTPAWEEIEMVFPLLSPLQCPIQTTLYNSHPHTSSAAQTREHCLDLPNSENQAKFIASQTTSDQPCSVQAKLNNSIQSLTQVSSHTPWCPQFPFSAFIHQDEQSIKLLIKELASFTDLLAALVPNRPRTVPGRNTADWTGTEQSALSEDFPSGVNHSEAEYQRNGEGRSEDLRRPCLVQWLDLGQSGVSSDLFGQYQVMLWAHCCQVLELHFNHPPPSGAIGSINLWSLQMKYQLLSKVNHICNTELVPNEFRTMVKQFCLELLVGIAFTHWDYVLCGALGSGLKDKCVLRLEKNGNMSVPLSERDGSMVVTSTTEGFFQLFPPLLSVLHCLHSLDHGSVRDISPAKLKLQRTSATRVLASIQISTLWVMSKAYQFLSSWNLQKFLLVTQGDLKLLSASIEKLLLQHTEALTAETYLYSNHLHHILFKQQTHELHQAVLDLQAFSEQILRIFSMDCKRMSGEIFEQTMPSAKYWKLDCKTDFPSIYAASAAQSVICQVLKGVEPLPDEDRALPVAEATTAFMEAWMEHILKQKIKFSIQGALQLKQDFELIRGLIQSEGNRLSSELHQRLLSLSVFHQMDSAILCLLQQPMTKPYLPSNSWEPFRHCCFNRDRSVRQTSRGSIMALESMEGVTVCQEALGVGPDLSTTTTPESYLALGTAQQDWLNLRFHGASRWRVPGMHCFSNSEP